MNHAAKVRRKQREAFSVASLAAELSEIISGDRYIQSLAVAGDFDKFIAAVEVMFTASQRLRISLLPKVGVKVDSFRRMLYDSTREFYGVNLNQPPPETIQ